MDQDETWHGGRPWPGQIELDGDSAPTLPAKGAQQLPSFRSMSIVAKRSPVSATTELLCMFILCCCTFLLIGECMLLLCWV